MFLIGTRCTRRLVRNNASYGTATLRWTKRFYSSEAQDEKLRRIIQSSNLGNNQNETLKSEKLSHQSAESKPDAAKESNATSKTASMSSSNKIDTSTASSSKEAELFGAKLKQDIRDRVEKLPSQREELRNSINRKVDSYMDSLQQTIFKATNALNDVTGYSSIEQLKNTIDNLEAELKQAKETVKTAKDNYTNAIQERSLSQKEVNELLTRKHNWSQNDLERFTELYRNDHVNEQKEISAQEALTKAEQQVDSIQLKLTQSILTRYHEEQIWSDKIRRASTWGTWFLMGFNIMLFFVATFIVEPWKRRKMVGSFEDKVKQAIADFSSEQRGKMDKIITNQNKQEKEPTNGVYSVQFSMFSWKNFKTTIVNAYTALVSPEVRSLEFNKSDFGVFVSVMTVMTSVTVCMVTRYFMM